MGFGDALNDMLHSSAIRTAAEQHALMVLGDMIGSWLKNRNGTVPGVRRPFV